MSEEHQSFIKTPRQLITVIVLAFLVPMAIIGLLARFVDSGMRIGAGADAMTAEAIEARIRPVARVQIGEGGAAGGAAAPAAPAAGAAAKAPAASAPAAPAPAASATAAPAAAPASAAPATPAASTAAAADGKKVYEATCMLCHGAGVAGAPKYGDKAAWAPRVATGEDTLVEHSIKGIRAMPPRGGNGSLTDAQVRAAVQYMLAALK
ncbi:MAG: c-type cytochrome [Burkholderiaceae bacterium]|nr:c-type cytochrome [Burkholderiaceae bacterium]